MEVGTRSGQFQFLPFLFVIIIYCWITALSVLQNNIDFQITANVLVFYLSTSPCQWFFCRLHSADSLIRDWALLSLSMAKFLPLFFLIPGFYFPWSFSPICLSSRVSKWTSESFQAFFCLRPQTWIVLSSPYPSSSNKPQAQPSLKWQGMLKPDLLGAPI